MKKNITITILAITFVSISIFLSFRWHYPNHLIKKRVNSENDFPYTLALQCTAAILFEKNNNSFSSIKIPQISNAVKTCDPYVKNLHEILIHDFQESYDIKPPYPSKEILFNVENFLKDHLLILLKEKPSELKIFILPLFTEDQESISDSNWEIITDFFIDKNKYSELLIQVGKTLNKNNVITSP